jgi:replicative DNA helicase
MEKRNTVMQLLGCLMKNPLFLGEANTYCITPNDFSRPLDKQIFMAIFNLFSGGAARITAPDIEEYFKAHPGVHENFTKSNGIEYLLDAEDFGVVENFEYYYKTLKKHNAIKDLQKSGFDVSDFYSEDPLDKDQEEKMKKFDEMTVVEIFDRVKSKLAKLEGDYTAGASTRVCYAIDNIGDLLENLKAAPEVGVGLPGYIYNTVVRGARKGKFYLQSSGTGVGKTRRMVGEACYIAYPIRYDWSMKQWVQEGSCEKVLYVGTEQTIQEIQTLILAYLSGINEEKILYGKYNEEEKEILEQTLRVMEIYSDNFTIAQLPDPTIQLVRSTIRKECLLKDIEYVFYDYIFSSPGLLGEFRDLRVREDVALGMLSTALKDLAVELDVFMRSATQVNGDLQDLKGIRDQRCIRGAKSIADKIDCGMVTAKVSPQELLTLDKLIREKGIRPNQVSDIYKMRRGRFNDIRIWTEMDLGTCRIKDLFVTDVDLKPVADLYPLKSFLDNGDDFSERVLRYLNFGEALEEEIQEEMEVTENVDEILSSLDRTNPDNWII